MSKSRLLLCEEQIYHYFFGLNSGFCLKLFPVLLVTINDYEILKSNIYY